MSRTFAMLIMAIGFMSTLTVCAVGAQDGSDPISREPLQMLSLKRDLSYRARIALPPESVAVVELRDVSSTNQPVVKEQRIPLQGKQVPIPFELIVERTALKMSNQYRVRGGILLAGKPTWATETVSIDPAAVAIDLGTLNMTPVKAEAFTTTFRCGNQNASIGYMDNAMQLTVGEETFEMQPVKAGSGAKYEATGDSTTTFWSKGNRATLVVRGQAYPECMQEGTEAKVFRATGNEPGWKLEIGDTRMAFLADNGQTRIEVPPPVAETTAEFRKYRAKTGSHELTVTIFERVCTDTMSGMPYPNQVAVVFDGRELNGCGGDPAALLQGAEWVVEDINGAGLVDRSRATLNFGADGRISGRGSCNTYTGQYSLTGEGLTVSKTAMTMMACVPALMQQEDLFLDVLKNIQRFTLSPDGALILHTADKRTITARRG